MSAESIARWNAIPLDRPEPGPEQASTLKRSRSEDGHSDRDDDDVSLVSRSPSPVDRMDVDQSIDKYDEYHRGPTREVITVETRLKSTNKGFAMLAKMGWAEGQPLGLSGDGRIDPIPFTIKNDSTGLGKVTQDVRMIETTVSQRRELDSERMTKESEEQRKAREDAAAKKAALQQEISSTLRPFYCELCDKQFKNVAQYDEHTNSYAHHHKARARDMQAAQKLMQGRGTKEDVDRRKEKERKREEREMRKLAAAAGIKLAKPPALASAAAAPAPSETAGPSTGFKKSGWATLSPAPQGDPSRVQQDVSGSSSGVAPSARADQAGPRTPRPPSNPAPAFSSAGQMSLGSGPTLSQVEVPSNPSVASSFRSGWAPPSQTATPSAIPPATPSGASGGGWARAAPLTPAKGGWATVSDPALQQPAGSLQTTSENQSSDANVAASTAVSPVARSSPGQRPRPAPEEKRSSWQNFKKKSFR